MEVVEDLEFEEELAVDLPWDGVGPRRYTMREKVRILDYLYRHRLIPFYSKPAVYQMMIRDCPELADRTIEGLRALVRQELPRVDTIHICMHAKQQFHRALEHLTANTAIKAAHQANRREEGNGSEREKTETLEGNESCVIRTKEIISLT